MNEFSLFNDRNDRSTPEESRVEEINPEMQPIVENARTGENVPVVSPAPTFAQPSISRQTREETADSVPIPVGTFEHDLAIGDRAQKFSGEILRLALIGVAALGFLLVNFLLGTSDKNAEMLGVAKRTLADSDFRFYVSAAFFLFAFSAGLSLLNRYFAAEGQAANLKLHRLREKLRASGVSSAHIATVGGRGFFDGFWLYLIGSETDEPNQQIENERDARDFLLRISRWLLFLSGLLLWLGVLSLILGVGVIFKYVGTLKV